VFDFYLILPDGSKQQNQIKKSLYYDDRRKLEQAAGTIKPFLETSGADAGKIKIPQGTPAGNYEIEYESPI